MKFIKKKFFLLGLIITFTFFSFNNTSAEEYNNQLVLHLESPLWGNLIGGETKTANLTITNNTGYDNLTGKATLQIEYQGPCSNNKKQPFEGDINAISPQFRLQDGEWIVPDTDWQNGIITFSNFFIPLNDTSAYLKINTNLALCPGSYYVTFILEGTTEEGKTYTAAVVLGGGFAPTTTITTKPLTTSTTIPGRIAGATTEREFSSSASPHSLQTPSTTFPTTTTTRPSKLLMPKFTINPLVASLLSLFNPWITGIIALGSFSGAATLWFREKKKG